MIGLAGNQLAVEGYYIGLWLVIMIIRCTYFFISFVTWEYFIKARLRNMKE